MILETVLREYFSDNLFILSQDIMRKASRIALDYILKDTSRLVPNRVMGKTGLRGKAFGLGGQSLLEQENSQKQACDLIRKALSLGVNYFDTATIYGPSRYYYGLCLKSGEGTIVASKVRERSYSGAKKELDETFRLLQRPYIDILQLHSIQEESDKKALRKDGALQVLREAQQAGKIGYIGITGHADPQILMDFMDEYPFDTLLIALNPTIPLYDEAVKKAKSLNMGVIAMKVMSRGILPKAFSPTDLIHYALDRADVAIVGCSDESDVERNIISAAEYTPGKHPTFSITPELIEESTYFVKGHSGRWPDTYQPDWPKIQYD